MVDVSEVAKSLRLVGLTEVDEAADLIEQQAARIAELEAAIRKQANAARSLADATIRDASIRQGLAEKAYAESSPEVLASERQANAMLTEENERLTARLTDLESERDALLAAAGKEAGRDTPYVLMDGTIYASKWSEADNAYRVSRTPRQLTAEFMVAAKNAQMLKDVRSIVASCTDRKARTPYRHTEAQRVLPLLDSFLGEGFTGMVRDLTRALDYAAAPTAALEKGDGRAQAFDALLAACQEAIDWYPSDAAPPYMRYIREAVALSLSQKAGEQQCDQTK